VFFLHRHYLVIAKIYLVSCLIIQPQSLLGLRSSFLYASASQKYAHSACKSHQKQQHTELAATQYNSHTGILV
jgi:hypothetical protein